jgi:hypothetical protein
MSKASEEDSFAGEEDSRRRQETDEVRRLRKREYNRRYRESNPEKNSTIRRSWVEANRDRIRESNRRWRAENIERARQLNRDAARRAVLRRQKDTEERARGRDRAKRWRDAHLDEIRSYHKQWVAQNSDKIREYSVRYYNTHRDEVNARAAARRDANPERANHWRRAWAERNSDRLAELQRERRKNPEIYQAQLEANSAARRLKRRLANTGLPPKRVHPAKAAERRTNEQAADKYFSDPSLAEHVRQLAVFTETLTSHLRVHEPNMREFAASYLAFRARLGLPPVAVDDVVYSRAVEVVLSDLQRTELLSSRDIFAAVRNSRSVLQREQCEHQSVQLLRTVVAHVSNQRDRLESDVDLENLAREQRGLPRVQSDALLLQLALREVVELVPTDRLTTANIRAVCRSARARVRTRDDTFLSNARLTASSPSIEAVQHK